MTEREAQLPFEPVGNDPPAFAQLARLELRVSIQVALKALNPREREALIRKHVAGQSYREIARALYGSAAGDKEEGRLSVMLTRARRKLKERLEEIEA
jgi:RNA polymerase sigma factor (sigma-70 family)